MTKLDELRDRWLEEPEVRGEYDALEEEFSLAAAMIDARTRARLTQDDVAARMRTTRARVANLEGAKGDPSIATLRRYAEATGTRLKISFEPPDSR